MSQTDKILAHLKKGRTLTPLEALRLFKAMRLGARIKELRYQYGQDSIATQMVTIGGKRVAKYYWRGK